MQHAFDTADAYQIPTFVLSDQYFLDAISPLDTGDVPRIPFARHVTKTAKDYRRYVLTKDGLSPRGVPGYGDGLVCVDSDEHDESGHITESFDVRKDMMDKRSRRLDTLRNNAMMPKEFDNCKDAETAVISWGSNHGVLEETLGKLGSVRLGGLHFAGFHGIGLTRIIEQSVNGFLEHSLFISKNNLRGTDINEFFQPVVTDDNSAIKIIKIGCGKPSAF